MKETISFAPSVRTFDSTPCDKETALKVLEEASEVVEAWKRWNEVQTFDRYGDLIEEMADVVQAVANLASAVGCHSLVQPMRRCRARNVERGRISE